MVAVPNGVKAPRKVQTTQQRTGKSFWKRLLQQRVLILMLLPAMLITFIFHYIPLTGIVIAFKKYNVAKGIWGSDWVGLRWFEMFFKNPFSPRILKNTILLGVFSFLWTFPAPIVLALLFNEIKHSWFKRLAQTISYLPHFISTIIIVGMLKVFASETGLFNEVVAWFGQMPIQFFAEPGWFRTLFIGSGLWQGIGWGTIIYLAALAGVPNDLYEAATIDGATRWKKVWYITIPAIMPTVMLLFILSIGGIMGTDAQKVLLMYSPLTYETADVLDTYIFREGIEGGQYSYTAAIGIFTSLISFFLLYLTNWISRKVSENSLW